MSSHLPVQQGAESVLQNCECIGTHSKMLSAQKKRWLVMLLAGHGIVLICTETMHVLLQVEYASLSFLPSQQAAAAVLLALYTLQRQPWTPTLAHYTG